MSLALWLATAAQPGSPDSPVSNAGLGASVPDRIDTSGGGHVGLFDGKVAVVTGSGRGLGRAHALALAAEGASVVVNDVGGAVGGGGRDSGPADEVVAEIVAEGGSAVTDATDVSTIAGGEALIAVALAAFGRVDVLVNNAGISRSVAIADLDDAVIDAHLGVHLKGVIGTTRAAFLAMAAQGGGAIVNTTSGAGLDPQVGGSSPYGMAKAALYSFTRTAAFEGAPIGVRVNAVSPLARTRMSEAYFSQARPGEAELLDPSRVSDAVVFLASDLADGITGRVIRIGGHDASEAFFTSTTPASADRWTPRLLASRRDEVLRAVVTGLPGRGED